LEGLHNGKGWWRDMAHPKQAVACYINTHSLIVANICS
jgi:hypothetical protein